MINKTQEELDEKYMLMALDQAAEAYEEDEVPVGAVIVVNGKVIAKAHNLTERLCDVTAHAEMQALTAAANYLGGKYLTDCTLYVTVEPCAMCAAALGWAQIGRIVYGASDEKRGYRKVYGSDRGPLHPKTEITSGLMEEEASELMKSFFRNKRKLANS